jgi:hypothetical protein
MQRGEEPGFRLRAIAQLVALRGPDAEGFLHQISGSRRIAR